jgi:TRAP-type mannitol/chloroaromatic compound transport system substrate-binding protein
MMSPDKNLTPRAALIAVLAALIVGVLASLAIRPAGQVTRAEVDRSAVVGRESVHWRVTSSFTTQMPVVGETIVDLADQLRAVSGGAIDLQIFEPGEVVPAFEITESVKEGKIEAGYLWVGYDQGRIPASTLIAAVPFGMEPVEFASWWYYGGGRELGEELYREHNVMPLLCALSGPETAGWFRQPVRSLEDLQGLKIRFAGIGGKIMQRLGASVTMIPGGEVFQALEKGAIDASEFSMPAVDAMLGFGRIAKYNYFPGWHQPFSSGHLVINLAKWNGLQDDTRSLLRMACRANVNNSLAESEAIQGPVILGFAQQGITAETLPPELLLRLREVANEVLDEEAAANEDFAKILASQRQFSAIYSQWRRKAYLPADF